MTQVRFPDQHACSEHGRWRLEARSPDNGTIPYPDGRPTSRAYLAFQKHFRYRLIDTIADRVVWERWQGEGEPSPQKLHVSERGHAVLQLHGGWRRPATLLGLDPDGTLRTRLLVSSRREHDAARHIGDAHFRDSTAGLRWTDQAITYFLPHPERLVMATHWGRRIVVDLQDDRGSLPPDPALKAACQRLENGRGQALLRCAALLLEEDLERPSHLRQSDWGPLPGLMGCLIRNQCLAAAPLFAALAPLRWPRYSTASRVLPQHSRQCLLLQPLVGLMLRLAGTMPRNHPAWRLQHRPGAGSPPIPLPEVMPDRDRRLQRLSETMTGPQVIALLGAPDFINRHIAPGQGRGEQWHYLVGLGAQLHRCTLDWAPGDGGGRLSRVQRSAPLSRDELAALIHQTLAR